MASGRVSLEISSVLNPDGGGMKLSISKVMLGGDVNVLGIGCQAERQDEQELHEQGQVYNTGNLSRLCAVRVTIGVSC